jgi:hypothetical protein
MTNHLFSRRWLGVAIALVVFMGGLGASPALADTSTCSPPSLSQPLLTAKDNHWYTMVAGQTPGNFSGDGWTLSGGANIDTTTLADGQTGSVLDLPSGSRAVSPVMCVDSGYTTARTMVRNVVGGEGVGFYVSYVGTKTWDNPKNTGQVHGAHDDWTLSTPVNVQPSKEDGWQEVRFTFVSRGTTSDFQIYDFWVDPRMH